jgi:hypothetical protein
MYLVAGGFVGYVIGTPLGAYLKVFFNPPPPSEAASISQLYAVSADTVVTSALEAVLLTFLGIAVLTIALLIRKSDIPTEDEEDEGGHREEEAPAQPSREDGSGPSATA